MDDSETNPGAPSKKHLLPAGDVARATETSTDADLTRHHGQGNGLRVHGIYFGVVSLVVLVVLLIVIAFASDMM